ncbi:MAG: helix-turn-helix domain-containing protein, partial [Clostridia bacterium]|nr:helix-turn-helix domain-containing protein [Clostridia bacterium]
NFEAFSLHYVVSGSGIYTIKGKSYTVNKGHIFCIFPDEHIEYKPSPINPWTYYWINFTGSKAYYLLNGMNLSAENPVIKATNPAIKSSFVRTVMECEEHPEVSDQIALSNFYRITSLLHVAQNSSVNKNNDLVGKTLTFINKHYAKPELTIAVVAKNLNVYAAHLSRLFKKQTGLTFTSVLTSTRLKIALHLMNNGYDNLSEIAEAIGYNDPYYFSKVFKYRNGSPPSEYIKQIQNTQVMNV